LQIDEFTGAAPMNEIGAQNAACIMTGLSAARRRAVATIVAAGRLELEAVTVKSMNEQRA
jgi:hypothetical protein